MAVEEVNIASLGNLEYPEPNVASGKVSGYVPSANPSDRLLDPK